MSPFEKGKSGNPSGAKPRVAGERRARISASVAAGTDEWIRETAGARNLGIGDVVDLLVKHARNGTPWPWKGP